MLRNDPASDPEVERVARLFCAEDGHDPDAPDADGDQLWRGYVGTAIGAISAWKTLTR